MSGSATSPGVRPHGSNSRMLLVSVVELVREHAAVLTVWAAMIAWATTLFVVVRGYYLDFRLARYDLGNMVQAVWSTVHGRPLEITDGPTGEQIVRVGSHVDPILAALAPLWIVAPTPLTLVAVQIAAVSIGALAVFWLARRHLESDGPAVLLAMAYLSYPWIAWAAVDTFHPVTLAIPLFLFCVWFLDTGRLVAFAFCAVLVLMTGELMGLPLAALGIWYALARGRRGAGLGIAALGVGWTFIALYAIVPAFSAGSSVFYSAFDEVGGSPWGLVETAFTDPAAILSAISHGNDVLYVVALATPVGAAFLLAPGLAAVALPMLAINLLSDSPATTYPHLHYVAGIVPFVFAAIAIGLGRLSPQARMRGAVGVLTLSVVGALAAGPWPGQLGASPSWYWGEEVPAKRVRTLRGALALVPATTPVASTNRAGLYLSERRYLYSVPVLGRAEWIVMDLSDAWLPQTWGGRDNPEALRAFHVRIERSADWRKVFDQGGVLVFRKVRS